MDGIVLGGDTAVGDEWDALADVYGGRLVIGGDNLRAAQYFQTAIFLKSAQEEMKVPAADGAGEAAELSKLFGDVEIGADRIVHVAFFSGVTPFDTEIIGAVQSYFGQDHLDQD